MPGLFFINWAFVLFANSKKIKMKMLFRTKTVCVIATMISFHAAYSQNTWTQITDFSSARYYSVAMSIGGKGYAGLGQNDASVYFTDLWEYDPAGNSWTQKANFTGAGRTAAVAFSDGTKGYVGTGRNNIGTYLKDWYEYDPSGNSWTQKNDFAGAARFKATAFYCSNGKGYITTGEDDSLYYKDTWEYNPSGDSWLQKADFGGTAKSGCASFSIGDKGYVGGGTTGGGVFYKELWEYNSTNNMWTQKSDFPSTRTKPLAFAINNRGYLGGGNIQGPDYQQTFWKYNPATDSWQQMANLGGGDRGLAVGFAIGNKGYIGTGSNDISELGDFWEYTPDSIVAVNEKVFRNENNEFHFMNPNSGNFKLTYSLGKKENAAFIILDVSGKKLDSFTLKHSEESVNINSNGLTNGIYFYSVHQQGKIIASGKLLIVK